MRLLRPFAPAGSVPVRLLGAALAGAVVAYGLAIALGVAGGAAVRTWLAVAVMGAGVLTCAWRALALAEDRCTWGLMAIGLAASTAGELVYDLWAARQSPVPPVSVADALWLFPYLATGAALVLLLRRRMTRAPAGFWLDAVLAAVAVAAVAVAGTAPLLGGAGGEAGTVLRTIYAGGDLLLAMLIVGAFTLGGTAWSRAWTLLTAALVVKLVSDAVWAREMAASSFVPGTWFDLGWPLAVLLLALAAWQPPALREVARPRRWSRLLTTTACGVLALGVLVIDHFSPLNGAAVLLAGSAVVLVMVRFATVFAENVRLLGVLQVEVTTDTLTGLGNRRALLEALARADDPLAPPALLTLYDLDGFKHFNDTFGHLAGDALLERLAARLASVATAAGGRAYRLGGDEFCLLAPRRGAASRQERAGVRALSEHGDGYAITASAGSAELPDPAGVSAILRAADTRMYQDKANARRPGPRTAAA